MKKLMGTAFLVLALSGAAMAQDHGHPDGHGHAPQHNHGDAEPHRERGHADGHPDHVHAGGHDRGHADGQERERPPLGEGLKDIALTDSAGKAFRLAAFRRTKESAGTITVLTFWCTTCGSCRMVEKDFDKKARDYKDKGVQFLMVASNHAESPERVNRFLKQSKLSFRVLMDPESQIARYLGATTTTTTAVVDAEGRLRYYGGLAKAEDAVRNLIAGEEVAIPQTRPMGCMIMMK